MQESRSVVLIPENVSKSDTPRSPEEALQEDRSLMAYSTGYRDVCIDNESMEEEVIEAFNKT